MILRGKCLSFVLASVLLMPTYSVARSKAAKNKSGPRISRKIASSKALSPAEAMIVKYFSCFDGGITERPKIESCVQSYIHPKLSKSDKDRFYSWLIVFNVRLEQFIDCTEAKITEIGGFPQYTENYICGQIAIGDETKEAVFFFKQNGPASAHIYSIYY